MIIQLSEEVREVVSSIKKLRDSFSNLGLKFTPDGKFVGDLGEAIAAETFGIELEQGVHIDGKSKCGKKVQIKATGRNNGSVYFRKTNYQDASSVHLIAIRIDWENREAEVVYNGPEKKVRPTNLREREQVGVSIAALRRADAQVKRYERIDVVSS